MRTLLAGPSEVQVDGAMMYWLGTSTGDHLGPESDRSLAPCALALRLVGDGSEVDELVLWARLQSGMIHRVAEGVDLIGIAESAAGIRASPRAPRE